MPRPRIPDETLERLTKTVDEETKVDASTITVEQRLEVLLEMYERQQQTLGARAGNLR